MELYNSKRQTWFEEMVTSTLILERHEMERINKVKTILEQYTKLLSNASLGGSKVGSCAAIICYDVLFLSIIR